MKVEKVGKSQISVIPPGLDPVKNGGRNPEVTKNTKIPNIVMHDADAFLELFASLSKVHP